MSCRPAICSHSLGRAWVHSLESKLAQAAKFGFDIELFYEDLVYAARELSHVSEPGPKELIIAAHHVRSLCDGFGIAVVCLQPFMHYEGIRDRVKHAQRVEEMKLWIKLAALLNTHIIAIPSTFLSTEEMSGDMDLIVRDLREVADLGAPFDMQFAYESLAWGTYSDTWEQSWKVVKAVDRSNFGICLDTFNMAGRIYADPAAPSGKTRDADTATKASIERLVREIDVSKIVFVQVVDAEKLAEPLVEGHEYYEASQPARMSWSRNCRLFYGEEDRGAYLPVKAILKAILVDLRFEGWVSAEMFNRSLTDPRPSVPAEHAERAAISWHKIVEDCRLNNQVNGSSAPNVVVSHAVRAQL